MSSPLTAKRRKLNNGSNALYKPFVSPLKTSGATSTPVNRNGNTTTVPSYRPSTLAHTTTIPPNPANGPPNPNKIACTPTRPHPLRKSNLRPTAHLTEKGAQRALTALEVRIRATRNEIDTLNQAARLSASTTDTDLEILTHKWKLASQSAAEELFGTVKERVNRMGGVQAWREAERGKVERRREWDEQERWAMETKDDGEDCEVDEEGNELPEEEVAWRKKEKARVKRERMEAADVETRGEEVVGEDDGEEAGRDDDCFTMDMMLRTMGVDLKLIGWDMVEQVWVS